MLVGMGIQRLKHNLKKIQQFHVSVKWYVYSKCIHKCARGAKKVSFLVFSSKQGNLNFNDLCFSMGCEKNENCIEQTSRGLQTGSNIESF